MSAKGEHLTCELTRLSLLQFQQIHPLSDLEYTNAFRPAIGGEADIGVAKPKSDNKSLIDTEA